MRAKLTALSLVWAGLGGCASVMTPSSFEGGAAQIEPEVFFAGSTSSSGVLKSVSGAPAKRLHVVGTGRTLADGSFRLDQSITFDQGAPSVRTWTMLRIDAHHFTATLSDASGPVRGEAYGDVLHLSYPMKTPFGGRMEQWMYLQPDGRTLVNKATVRVLGIPVAHISERISRTGPTSDDH